MNIVTCGQCAAFKPDLVHPEQGLGDCTLKAWSQSRPANLRGYASPPWPFSERFCTRFSAKETNPE